MKMKFDNIFIVVEVIELFKGDLNELILVIL